MKPYDPATPCTKCGDTDAATRFEQGGVVYTYDAYGRTVATWDEVMRLAGAIAYRPTIEVDRTDREWRLCVLRDARQRVCGNGATMEDALASLATMLRWHLERVADDAERRAKSVRAALGAAKGGRE